MKIKDFLANHRRLIHFYSPKQRIAISSIPTNNKNHSNRTSNLCTLSRLLPLKCCSEYIYKWQSDVYYQKPLNQNRLIFKNFMKQPSLFTKNAISMMLDLERGAKQAFIVEASNFKPVHNQKYMKVQLYDGISNVKAIIDLSNPANDLRQVGKPSREKLTFHMTVTEHVTHSFEGNKVLEILNFVIQQPVLKKAIQPTENLQKNQEIKEESSHDRRQVSLLGNASSEVALKETLPTIDQNQLREFQKITDLYADFQGWQIVGRVLDTSYKEFNSKSGKLTKIFTMRVIDRSGLKIQATMFGDDARQFYNKIHQNQVYKISRGQIKENSYNQQREESLSRYIISLTRNSELTRIEDIKSIPKAIDMTVPITQLLDSLNFEKLQDVVAILLQIGEEKTIDKEEGRTIYKRSFIIGDPERRKSIQAILWSKNIAIPEEFIGKTVLLKSFRLSSYRERLSLCSTYRSEIVLKTNHKYNQFQSLGIEYDSVSSNAKQSQKESSQTTTYKSIQDLENELNYLHNHEAIISDLQFWLTFINFKNKWYYNACNNPKCKKLTEEHSKCIHCGTYNTGILKKFILQIEITDFTGSIWTTAFDDFACEIFKNSKLEDLVKLTELQLKQQGEKRLYQQFKGRISTRRAQDGLIRHSIVGKPTEVIIEKAMLTNLEKIKNAIYCL